MNNENILSNNINISNSISNIISMKCTKALFTKEGLITNIGNYILSFSFIFFIISAIIFYKFGYIIIENKINEIVNIKVKNKTKIDIFGSEDSINKPYKKMKKKKKKKNTKISNPTIKKKKTIRRKNDLSTMKLNLKNTNIFINIENNKSKELASNEINIFKKKENFYNNRKYKDFE